jgi:hypothetical protein
MDVNAVIAVVYASLLVCTVSSFHNRLRRRCEAPEGQARNGVMQAGNDNISFLSKKLLIFYIKRAII